MDGGILESECAVTVKQVVKATAKRRYRRAIQTALMEGMTYLSPGFSTAPTQQEA